MKKTANGARRKNTVVHNILTRRRRSAMNQAGLLDCSSGRTCVERKCPYRTLFTPVEFLRQRILVFLIYSVVFFFQLSKSARLRGIDAILMFSSFISAFLQIVKSSHPPHPHSRATQGSAPLFHSLFFTALNTGSVFSLPSFLPISTTKNLTNSLLIQ